MYFRRLRDLREDRDLKQTDVAALLGIRQTVYSRYERGYQNLVFFETYYHRRYYKIPQFDVLTFTAKCSILRIVCLRRGANMRRGIHYLIPLFRYAQHHLTGAAFDKVKPIVRTDPRLCALR